VKPVEAPVTEGEAAGEAHTTTPVGAEECGEHGCIVVPYVRVASTDLNFTMGLGLVSVVMSWYYGFRALGAREYLSRFFNTRGFKNSLIFGSLDFVVGLLELLGEFTRIISFTFRLFGNIFAGSIMIFVFSTLIPAVVPAGVYLLEVFVGAIQAFVFMMLTVVFIHLATIGHGGEAHDEAHAEAH
jgi:F-type H+-transporting ATPase subunit a